LTTIDVNANTTQPLSIVNQVIYDENIEFTTSQTGTSADFDDLVDPFSGTKSIAVTAFGAGDELKFTGAPFSPYDFQNLQFQIRPTAGLWGGLGTIKIAFFNGATAVSNQLIIDSTLDNAASNPFALDSRLDAWQTISIPLTAFLFSSNIADSLSIIKDDGKAAVTFKLDLIRLQLGIIVVPTVQKTRTSQFINDGSDGTSTYTDASQLGAVAFTSNYDDLTNIPIIPAAISSTADITNQGADNTSTYIEADELGVVATTNNYNDLSNLPIIPAAITSTAQILNQGADNTSTYIEFDELGAAAFSNDYNDLANLPAAVDLTSYVPYTGAIADLNMGLFDITADTISSTGSISEIYTANNKINIAGTAATLVLSDGNSFSASGNTTSMYSQTDAVFLTKVLPSFNQKTVQFDFSAITENQTSVLTIPDADGTIALLSDIADYVPYTGATANVDLNARELSNVLKFNSVSITSGTADVNGIAIGSNAQNSQTGTGVIAIGSGAAYFNTGTDAIAIGANSLNNNIGFGGIGIGKASLHSNKGIFVIAIGEDSLAANQQENVIGIGSSTGKYNAGRETILIGSNSGRNNAYNNLVSIGNASSPNNTGINTTVVGYSANTVFEEDVANAKNVADAATDIGLFVNTVTIVSHGFGTTNSFVNLKYTTTGTAISGLSQNEIRTYKIEDANTISLVKKVNEANWNSAGTNTHTFTPPVHYDNATVLGAFAQPTKSNQVTLGSPTVTEVDTYGAIRSRAYGAGTKTGTPTYNIVVDANGNFIETALSAGGGGVQSVTGTQVNNTDPANPIIIDAVLQRLDEGSGSGVRLFISAPADFGNIGLDAVDFSYSDTGLNNYGAS
jgi:hypothetical protein